MSFKIQKISPLSLAYDPKRNYAILSKVMQNLGRQTECVGLV